eukprot:gene12527-8581_t
MTCRTLGFTGTIASGKSVRAAHVCALLPRLNTTLPRQLQRRGVAVKTIDADTVGHSVYAPGSPGYHEVIAAFGTGVLLPVNQRHKGIPPAVDRRALGRLIFADRAKRETLNSICWPRIGDAVRAMHTSCLQEAAAAAAPFTLILIEAALLVELPAALGLCDDVWVTHCNVPTAVRRVMARDSLTETEALQRVRSQYDVAELRRRIAARGYDGGVLFIDTSTGTLAEGLERITQYFTAYWKEHICLTNTNQNQQNNTTTTISERQSNTHSPLPSHTHPHPHFLFPIRIVVEPLGKQLQLPANSAAAETEVTCWNTVFTLFLWREDANISTYIYKTNKQKTICRFFCFCYVTQTRLFCEAIAPFPTMIVATTGILPEKSNTFNEKVSVRFGPANPSTVEERHCCICPINQLAYDRMNRMNRMSFFRDKMEWAVSFLLLLFLDGVSHHMMKAEKKKQSPLMVLALWIGLVFYILRGVGREKVIPNRLNLVEESGSGASRGVSREARPPHRYPLTVARPGDTVDLNVSLLDAATGELLTAPFLFTQVPLDEAALTGAALKASRNISLMACLQRNCTVVLQAVWQLRGFSFQQRHPHQLVTFQRVGTRPARRQLLTAAAEENTSDALSQPAALPSGRHRGLYTSTAPPSLYTIFMSASVSVDGDGPPPPWKAILYYQMDHAMRMQHDMGLSRASSWAWIKEMFLFPFWKGRKDFKGISLRTLIINCYAETVTTLYLLEKPETSWAVLIPCALEAAADPARWRPQRSTGMGECVAPNQQQQPPATDVKEEKSGIDQTTATQWEVAAGAREVPLQMGRYRLRVLIAGDTTTRRHDATAVRYLLFAITPLLIAYAVYSALYHSFTGWFQYLLYTQIRFIYFFGFAVGQLPWRTFIYKALSTVIDNFFSFDVVFAILLYQRWIYPVDERRLVGEDGRQEEREEIIAYRGDGGCRHRRLSQRLTRQERRRSSSNYIGADSIPFQTRGGGGDDMPATTAPPHPSDKGFCGEALGLHSRASTNFLLRQTSMDLDELFGTSPTAPPEVEEDDIFATLDTGSALPASEAPASPPSTPTAPAAEVEGDELAGLSAAALQRLIEEEEDAHERQLQAMREKAVGLQQQITLEQEQLARELPELLRLQDQQQRTRPANGDAKRRSSHATGSAVVDQCLEQVEAYARVLGTSTQQLLSKASEAAGSSVVRSGTRWVPARGAKTSSVVFLFHPAVRGVRQWAARHTVTCPRCATAAATARRRCATFLPPEGRRGVALMPNLRAIPLKQAYSLDACVLQETPLDQRSDEDMFFPLLRFRAGLHLRHSSAVGRNPESVRSEVENFLNRWLNRLLSKAAAETAAIWAGAPEVEAVAPAVEIFLHSLSVRAEVTLRAAAMPSAARHRDPTGATQEEVRCHLQIQFATPLHVNALAPFLDMLQNKQLRQTFLFNVVQPVLLEVASRFSTGGAAKAHEHVHTALRAAQAVWSIAEQHSGANTTPAARLVFLQRWHNIFNALATHGTSVHAECAVPQQHSSQQSPQGRDLLGLRAARECGARFARAFLRLLSPPGPPGGFPPQPDPKSADIAVQIQNMPTSLAEVLATEFSDAASSGAAPSFVNMFLSSKTKVTLGLRMFSEFCVDIYRPFHPSTGIRVGESQVYGAPSCLPRVSIPPDVVNANLMVAQAHEMLMEVLQNTELRSEALMASAESTYKTTEVALKDVVAGSEMWHELRSDFDALGVAPSEWEMVQCDALLPLHQFELLAPPAARSQPLLYGSVSVNKFPAGALKRLSRRTSRGLLDETVMDGGGHIDEMHSNSK